MRRLVIATALASAVAWLVTASRATPDASVTPVATPAGPSAGPLYDPDPAHIWNRVDRQLRIRITDDGVEHGADALDPPLWRSSRHLLSPPVHATTLALLDEFLRSGAERLVTDPVKRAIFQRDLWAVFDWTVSAWETDAEARPALAAPLARMIRKVALTPEQIAKLPDPHAAAVAAGRHPAALDPARRDLAFLPPRLFDSTGPWVAIHGTVPVEQHSDELSRSSFGVFLSLPGGRRTTTDYLKRLWETPEPFVADRSVAGEQRTMLNPALHSLPPGTHIALVRRMLLVDTEGQIRQSPLVESLQIRVFRTAEPVRSVSGGHNDQDFFEFVLSRSGLFAAPALGLRALRRSDEEFLTFSSHGIDPFERDPRLPLHPGRAAGAVRRVPSRARSRLGPEREAAVQAVHPCGCRRAGRGRDAGVLEVATGRLGMAAVVLARGSAAAPIESQRSRSPLFL